MTLVEDLQAIDFSDVVDARATITVTASGPELTGVLSGDVGATALGDLGEALASVRAAAEHPETLLEEVLDALPDLAAIPNLEELDLDAWADAVREGAELVAGLVAALGGDLSRIGDLVSGAGGDLLRTARTALDDYTRVGVGELARLRRLVDTVEAGVPTQPEAFARLALDVLLPVPAVEVERLRGAVSGVIDGAARVGLPDGRVDALVEAHAAVAVAAEDGDEAAVRAALSALERTRDATLAALESDVRFAVERLHGLRVPGAVEAIDTAARALGVGRTGVIEFLDRLRAELAAAREGIESLDTAAARAAITAFLDDAEARAEEMLVEPVEERVQAVETWVRELFSHLPLRTLRAELSALVERAVAAIEEADLDAPAEAVRARLRELEQEIAELDLGAIVRAALDAVEEVLSGALDAIAGALEAIGNAVDAVADDARVVVERAVELLRQLAAAVEEARRAIDQLPIEEAQREVIDAIRELRGKAEELLSQAELPEALRPVIEQLTGELRNVDLEGALLAPVDEALGRFHVLEDLGIVDAVRDIQQALSNLVPAQLAAELDAQLDAVLDGIRAFRPDRLRALVEDFLDEVARVVDGVELDPVRELAHQPFAALLDAFDLLKPSVVLRPVLDAYDDLVGAAALPDPVAASERLLGAAADAAGGLAAPLTDTVERLAPGRVERTDPQAPPEAGAPPRPGDVVRLLGYLPARLREALAPLGPDARRAAIDAVGRLVGGVAADLRRMHVEVLAAGERLDAGLDAQLAPLAAAEMRAQLELTARFEASADGAQAGAEATVDLGASLQLVTSAGPLAMRGSLGPARDLAATTVDRVAGSVGAGGAAIDAAAAALERSPLVRLVDDVDAFLAALDPEPLAAELDALVDAARDRLPELFDELGAELEAIVRRAQRFLLDHNPAMLLQRFLKVLDAVREELDVLNPHVLARELDTVHDAARATLESYDPAVLVDDAGRLLDAIAQAIRDIDLDGFPGEADLADLGAAVDRVEAAVPAEALADAGQALADAGEALQEIDLLGLVEEVEELPERVQAAMHAAVAAVKDELLALLGALRYQQTSASVEVSGSVSGGIG